MTCPIIRIMNPANYNKMDAILVFSHYPKPVQVIIKLKIQTKIVLIWSTTDLVKLEIYFVTLTPHRLKTDILNTPKIHIVHNRAFYVISVKYYGTLSKLDFPLGAKTQALAGKWQGKNSSKGMNNPM